MILTLDRHKLTFSEKFFPNLHHGHGVIMWFGHVDVMVIIIFKPL